MFRHLLGSKASAHVEVAPEGKHCRITNVIPLPPSSLSFYLWADSLCPLPGPCPLPAPWWGMLEREHCSAVAKHGEHIGSSVPSPHDLSTRAGSALQWASAMSFCTFLALLLQEHQPWSCYYPSPWNVPSLPFSPWPSMKGLSKHSDWTKWKNFFHVLYFLWLLYLAFVLKVSAYTPTEYLIYKPI